MKTKFFKYTYILIVIIGISLVSISGCKKLVDADPPIDKTTAEAVFSTAGSASATLQNIYYLLYSRLVVAGESGCSVMGGLVADELVLYDSNNQNLQALNTNSLSSKTEITNGYWIGAYDLIFRINSVIEGVESSKKISISAKNELIGQAKFLRAFVYFYLVNLYGGVPLLTSTDYKINMLLPRSNEDVVYNQITKDLIEAQGLVSENYLKSDLLTVTPERVTANKAVVTALLARIYLYTEQWQKSEEEATKVISDSRFTVSIPLNEVFLKNSAEAIWQIEGDISKGQNSLDGSFFVPFFPGEMPLVYLNNNLLKVFDVEDQRYHQWLNTETDGIDTFFYPFKYKKGFALSASVTTEYNMLLRLAEQYLIRAEARAHLNNLSGSLEDLNVIRKRAGIQLYSSLNHSQLIIAIERERQTELFSECGHRWFDLKRTGRADAVLGPIKESNWQSTDKLFPIPAGEFSNNPSLRGHQNPGYTEE